MGLDNFLGPLYLLGMDGLCLESPRLLFFQESAGGDGGGADSPANWSVDVEELVIVRSVLHTGKALLIVSSMILYLQRK